MVEKSRYKVFRTLSAATLISVYFLILVGGIVRSTGSGMGCPDWPKCFGKLVPPTDVSQLPPDYKEYYASYRQQKNLRFAKYLDYLGMEEKAQHIRSDASILQEADFNVFKTWTEFINRLIGAFTGLLIMGTMLYSFLFRREDPVMVVLTVSTFLLVVFQGWIGSIVVSTNLLPWVITFHMLIALLIVVLLIAIVMRAWMRKKSGLFVKNRNWLQGLILLSLLAMGVQILLGTQVREEIDAISAALSYELRDTWIASIGRVFLVHRSFSLFLLGLNALLVYFAFKFTRGPNKLTRSGVILMVLLLAEVALGIVLAYVALPPVAQPAHLLVSTLIFGLLVAMYLLIKENAPTPAANT